jgi:hypothetical protein
MAVEQSSTSVQERQDLSQIIRIDEAKVGNHLNGLVRETVQETLNKMLDAEAQEMCNAQRYEQTEARKDCRAGFYQHKLQTQAGEVELNVPKLRHAKFETAIIERYRRRESSIEEALMEMYLAGVSVRRVKDITEALWGMRVSAGTGSGLNQKLYERIEQWRNQPIPGGYPYLYLDGICLKRSWAGEVRNVSVLVAVGIGTDGFREILGVAEHRAGFIKRDAVRLKILFCLAGIPFEQQHSLPLRISSRFSMATPAGIEPCYNTTDSRSSLSVQQSCFAQGAGLLCCFRLCQSRHGPYNPDS